MIKISNKIQLFGLDLSSFAMDFKLAISGMSNWLIFRILKVEFPVALLDVNGFQIIYKGAFATTIAADSRKLKKIKFHALQLPKNIILEHEFSLPKLDQESKNNAIKLEAQRISPFPMDEALWVQEVNYLASGENIRIYLTSRALVKKYLLELMDGKKIGLQPELYEIWVQSNNKCPIVLNGFAENRRFRHQKIYQYFASGLVIFVLILVAAHFVSPMLQSRLRAIDSNEKYAALHSRVAPLLQRRDALLKEKDQLYSIQKITGSPRSILEAFELITNELPDDAYLQSLQIIPSEQRNEFRVTISGQTNNAAELMQRLGKLPSLRDVKSPAAATRPPGATKESFAIDFIFVPSRSTEVDAPK